MNNDFWSAVDKLVADCEIIIDRPKGSNHPRLEYVYPLDYGFLDGTVSPDGGGIDLWRGSLTEGKCDAIICTVDLLKRDSEIKLLIGCTEDEKAVVLRVHNDTDMQKGIMIMRESNAV